MNYFTIKIKNRLTGIFTDVDVRIENYGGENSFYGNDEYKRIVFRDMDYIVSLGDILEFEGYRWIVIQPKSINTSTTSCGVQRCNAVLKFTESTPLTESIIELDCILLSKMSGTVNNMVYDIPSGNLQATIPLDINSLKIKITPKPTRFLLGLKDYKNEYKAWEVESIDTISNIRINYYAATPEPYLGIINLILRESLIDKVKDDHSVGVAYQRYF
jgi:hypothetical protein